MKVRILWYLDIITDYGLYNLDLVLNQYANLLFFSSFTIVLFWWYVKYFFALKNNKIISN